MKKLIAKIIFVVVIVVFAGVNVYKSQQTSKYNLLLAKIHTLAQEIDDTIDGGELPEVTITCGRYDGRCYYMDWRSPSGLLWSCKFSGYQKHYCIDCPFL